MYTRMYTGGVVHLVRSGTRWMFQKRVPLDLVPILGRNPIRLALKVSGAMDARRCATRMAAVAEREFDKVRGKNMELDDILADDSLDERDKIIATLRACLETSQQAYEASEQIRAKQLERHRLDMAVQNVTIHKHYESALTRMTGAFGELYPKLMASLSELRQRKSRDGESTDVLDGLQQVLSNLKTMQGGIDAVVQRTEPKVLPLLSEGMKPYLDLKRAQLKPNEIEDSRYVTYTIPNAVNAFIAYAGDRPADQYAPSELESFVVALSRLPANWTKMPRFREMGLVEAGTYNAGLPQPYKTLAQKSVERGYVTPLKGVLEWICRQHDTPSPFLAVKITVPKTARPPEDREPLTLPQLNALFAKAAACARPDDRWLPLLGYLTGARIGELVFLQGRDIQRLDEKWSEAELGMLDEEDRPTSNPWLINLKEDIKVEGRTVRRRTKTAVSRRIIALSNVLDELGFIEWARSRKGFIFDGLHTDVKNPSGAASKRMSRLMKAAGIRVNGENQDVFHCLRHTTKDWLRDKRVSDHTINRQVGHADKQVATRYGSKPLRPKEVCELADLPLLRNIDLTGYRK